MGRVSATGENSEHAGLRQSVLANSDYYLQRKRRTCGSSVNTYVGSFLRLEEFFVYRDDVIYPGREIVLWREAISYADDQCLG